jgi:hypothetical protein
MEIASAIAVFFTLVLWVWKRRAAKKDDVTQQNREAYKEISEDLANRNAMRNSEHLLRDLDELERLRHAGDPKRPGSDATESGPGVHP